MVSYNMPRPCVPRHNGILMFSCLACSCRQPPRRARACKEGRRRPRQVRRWRRRCRSCLPRCWRAWCCWARCWSGASSSPRRYCRLPPPLMSTAAAPGPTASRGAGPHARVDTLVAGCQLQSRRRDSACALRADDGCAPRVCRRAPACGQVAGRAPLRAVSAQGTAPRIDAAVSKCRARCAISRSPVQIPSIDQSPERHACPRSPVMAG